MRSRAFPSDIAAPLVCSGAMPQFFDTHAHLDQEEFDDDRAEVLARARKAGVTTIVAVGTTADSSERCVELAAAHEGLRAAIGIQPNYCAKRPRPIGNGFWT